MIILIPSLFISYRHDRQLKSNANYGPMLVQVASARTHDWDSRGKIALLFFASRAAQLSYARGPTSCLGGVVATA